MNRSEPLRATISAQQVVDEFGGLVAFHAVSPCERSAREVFRDLGGLAARLGRRDRCCAAPGRCRFWSSVCMPMLLPVWIAEYICAILFSRIRLRIAGVPSMISCAATRPVPSLVLHSVCEITALQRLRQHRADHLLLRRREHVDDAVDGLGGATRCAACRTPGGRFRPRSAPGGWSPGRASRRPGSQSGSSRSAERSALANDSVCGPTSRWLIRHFFDSCTNSIGSSTVRMWPYSFSFRWLTIAASVVDLPEPVGPVTSTMPRGLSRRARRRSSGAFSCSSVRIFDGMVRNTAPAPRFWLKALTRKRARPGISNEKSHSSVLLVVLALRVVHDVVHHAVHFLVLQRGDVDAAHVAVHADHRRQAGRQVQVGGLVLDRERQQLGDVHGSPVQWRPAAACDALPRGCSAHYGDDRRQPASVQRAHCTRPARPPARPVRSVTLLAVSQDLRRRRACARRTPPASARFGENYVQEALDKIAALRRPAPRLEWHLIGPLQSNKTRVVAEHFDWVHSVDRLKIARAPVASSGRPTCRR